MATVAFVEIIVSLALYLDDITGGPRGIKWNPELVATWQLVLFVIAAAVLLAVVERTGIGRAFGAIRQDDISRRGPLEFR